MTSDGALTPSTVTTFLEQLSADRNLPYWADRLDWLDATEAWLLSLRDHLETNDKGTT